MTYLLSIQYYRLTIIRASIYELLTNFIPPHVILKVSDFFFHYDTEINKQKKDINSTTFNKN